MVVLVPGENVEQRASIEFGKIRLRQLQAAGGLERLFVGISARLVEVEVAHRAQALHVEFPAVWRAVEAASHEMSAAVFLQQPTITHRDPGGAGHQMIGKFDAPVAERIVDFLVAIGCHAVEFQQPRLEILASYNLA